MGREKKNMHVSTEGVGDFYCCDPSWETAWMEMKYLTGILRCMSE